MIKKLLIGLFLLSLIVPVSAGAVKEFQVDTGGTLTTDLISYWKLEDATDFFGSNDGSDTNISFVSGKVNNAASFNGSTSKIVIPYDASLDISGSISISAWVYPDNIVVGQIILARGRQDNTNDGNYLLRLDNRKVTFFYYDSTPSAHGWTTTDDVITHDVWNHIVVVYTFGTPGSIVIYVDNDSKAGAWAFGTGAESVGSFNDQLTLGMIRPDTTPIEIFGGDLDEMGIWSKLLSSTEVGDLWNSGSGQTMIEAVAEVELTIPVVWW